MQKLLNCLKSNGLRFKTHQERTLLFRHRFRVTEWFLQKGSDVNARDDGANTSLHLAIRKKYDLEAVRLLLRYGADVNIKNNEGISPNAMAKTNRQRKFLALFKSS